MDGPDCHGFVLGLTAASLVLGCSLARVSQLVNHVRNPLGALPLNPPLRIGRTTYYWAFIQTSLEAYKVAAVINAAACRRVVDPARPGGVADQAA